MLVIHSAIFTFSTSCRSLDRSESHDNHHLTTGDRDRRRSSVISSPRRTSAASSVSGIHYKKKRSLERSMVLTYLTYILYVIPGYGSEVSDRDRSSSFDYQHSQRPGRKYSFRKREH